MPALTIGRMAKLYGLHRSTLYEAVEKGRVTVGFDGKGQRVIDLSEMIRVYGEPPGQTRQNPTPSPDPDPTPDSYRELIEELRSLRSEVKELREAMLRLPAPERQSRVAAPQNGGTGARPETTPPERPEKPDTGRSTPPPTDAPPKGEISFADIEARLAARIKGQS